MDTIIGLVAIALAVLIALGFYLSRPNKPRLDAGTRHGGSDGGSGSRPDRRQRGE